MSNFLIKMKHRFSTILKAKFVFFLYKVINFFLFILSFLLWPRKAVIPQKICIYRIGNIGDIICAIPSIIAIRKAYPNAHITLLTSPGQKGAVGAKELIKDAWFIDRLWVYYSDDIDSIQKVIEFMKKLRRESFCLWITLPMELWNLKTILRNMAFIRLCKVKSVAGFMISTIKLWANAQTKLSKFDNEVERLMKILVYYNLPVLQEVDY
ncbi:MAG: hypothetical protein QMC83_10335, partial [Thermodesulfovibrionales bacterium]|nr:hypothetical protein [Thermodesulfovibrionales bacterium]